MLTLVVRYLARLLLLASTRLNVLLTKMSISCLPGAASIVDELDKRVMIILRDGRHLIGILRSFDQFMNLIIEETYERIIVGEKYSDILMGLYIVRGDNIVVMGEIDTVKESSGRISKVEPGIIESIVETNGNMTEWDFEGL